MRMETWPTKLKILSKKKISKVFNKDETIGMLVLICQSFSNLFHCSMIYLLSEINYNDKKNADSTNGIDSLIEIYK